MDHKILAPAIMKFDFPIDTCEKIFNIINENKLEWKNSITAAEKHSGEKKRDVRKSDQVRLDKFPNSIYDSVNMHVNNALLYYNISNKIQTYNAEGFNLLRYVESDYYDYHFDSSSFNYRTVSVLVYLNPSDYEGGETHFKNFDLDVKPEKPALIIFPSCYSYIHTAKPVKKGVKYVLTNWYNDLPKTENTRAGLTNLMLLNNEVVSLIKEHLESKKKEA